MKRSPNREQIIADLLATKLLIKSMKHSMPGLRAELERECAERLDDLINDVRNLR